MALVTRVREHLARGHIEQAFAALIDAWHATPAAPIGDAIDALDALEPPPPALTLEAWSSAPSTSHRERGALIRAMRGREGEELVSMIAVVASWRDPRLTSVVFDLLEHPTRLGKKSEERWGRVIGAASQLRDPRFLDIPYLPPVWNTVKGQLGAYLLNRLPRLNRADTEIELPIELERELDELTDELHRRALSAEEAALLDAIYARLDDDGPRLVYADWLQQRGDPRGELISLQLAPKRHFKRERALIDAHGRTWLGPLARYIYGAPAFRRGFFAEATLAFRSQRHAERGLRHREWATIETVSYWGWLAGTARLAHTMTSLRRVTRPDLECLLEAARPWPIEELTVDVTEHEFRRICESPVLPALRRLAVGGNTDPQPSWFAKLSRCPAEIELSDEMLLGRRFEWLRAVHALPVQRFTICYGEYQFRFSRDPVRMFTELDIEIHPRYGSDGSDAVRFLVTSALRSFAAKSLTRFAARIVAGGKTSPVPELVEAARRLIR